MVYQGLKTLDDVNVKGKIVFLRTDYNVPLDDQGNIVDDFRIRQSLPTLKKLFSLGVKQIIIASHLGRPKDKESVFKMDKVAERLCKLSGRKTLKLDDSVDNYEFPSPEDASIVVLENLRFRIEEELNDSSFAQKLVENVDLYVNDAFGVCHRPHASVHAVTKFVPGCIGLLVEKELKMLHSVLEKPDRPVTAIIGGSKLETKLPLIMNLLDNVDHLLLGGAMIFTFYKAKGYSVGKSLVDKDYVANARILANNDKIVLPIDVVVSDDKDAPSTILTMLPNNIPSYLIGLDIGNDSLKKFKKILAESKTIIWNGPMGYYENPSFAKATKELLLFLAKDKSKKVVIGGGDTATIAEGLGLSKKFYHVSTGGGASLNVLEGKELIAISELKKNTEKFL